MKPPHNVAFLERAIRKLASSNDGAIRIRTTLANVIAGQFLEGAVMRGGGSLKLRYGEMMTRYTMDFDAARSVGEEEFQEHYAKRLAEGWNGFSGNLVKKPKSHPRGVQPQYVMQPYEVKLTYNNHPWCTVDLEVSYDEIGDADDFDEVSLPEDVLELFCMLNFPEPRVIPLMRIEYQIAQKLHGATDTDYVRPQDLVDLQLMVSRERIDYASLNSICRRLFANRKKQAWPPQVVVTDEWRMAYDEIRGALPVLPTVDEAAGWAAALIAKIDAA